MPKITPFLWFNDNVEDALAFYGSIFKNSKVLSMSRYGEGAPRPAGMVMMAVLELEGQELILLNGGPEFQFNEAFSLFVNCESQEEVDRYWSQLTAGGEESQCGWLKDKFGLSWQIVPADFGKYIGGPDPAGAERAMKAMLAMKKLDISALQRAYEGTLPDE